MAEENEVHAQYPPASWKSDTMDQPVLFPVESITEDGSNRVVEQERAYRPGAKLDSTDWKGTRWRLRCSFNNTIQEDGIGDTPLLYPARLNLLIRSITIQETGTLVIPTRGPRRCKALSYSRSEGIEHNDGAELDLVFEEDSEDIINLDALDDPQVNATIVRLAQQTVFSAERLGILDDGTVDLVTWASQMESLLNAPGQYVDDIKAQGNRNRRAIKRVIAAERRLAQRNDMPFKGPEGHLPERLLIRLSDLQARAIGEKKSSRPPTRFYKVQSDCTIFDVAADPTVQQDAQKLMELNQDRIDDPMDIRAGDRVEVFR